MLRAFFIFATVTEATMKPKYDTDWLVNKYENGTRLKYIYFWGNTQHGAEVTKTCFSQWYNSPFIVNGITYNTAEHWMMAKKATLFNNNDLAEKIILCTKPAEAKELGRQVRGFNTQVWDDNKYNIVLTGSIHKFNQNPDLGNFLLNTDNRILVEASPMDCIWGIGMAHDNKDIENLYLWKGQNLLGFALMEARDFLRQHGFFTEVTGLEAPWDKYPGISGYDLFWRMGKGEVYIDTFSKHFDALTDKDKAIYQLYNPEPEDWKDSFY